MHSRIFKIYIPDKDIIDDKKEIMNGIRELIERNIEQEILDSASWSGMDYYTDSVQFEDDVRWLISSYMYNLSTEYELNKDNLIEVDERSVYELKGEEFRKFHEAIGKELDRRVGEVKKMLRSKKREDYWHYAASKLLYPVNGFLFYIQGYNIVNDVELYYAMKGADRLYIVESYDYHF